MKDFVESPRVQSLLVEASALANIDDFNIGIREFEEETGELSSTVRDNIGPLIEGSTIGASEILDESTPTINGYNEASIELDLTDIFYYGSGDFGVPFIASLEVLAYYYIYKGDWYAQSDEESLGTTITDHNRHYFEAESTFEIEVRGFVSLSVNTENVDFDEFSESIDSASIKIEELESILLA